jgi:hypothetical protein
MALKQYVPDWARARPRIHTAGFPQAFGFHRKRTFSDLLEPSGGLARTTAVGGVSRRRASGVRLAPATPAKVPTLSKHAVRARLVSAPRVSTAIPGLQRRPRHHRGARRRAASRSSRRSTDVRRLAAGHVEPCGWARRRAEARAHFTDISSVSLTRRAANALVLGLAASGEATKQERTGVSAMPGVAWFPSGRAWWRVFPGADFKSEMNATK